MHNGQLTHHRVTSYNSLTNMHNGQLTHHHVTFNLTNMHNSHLTLHHVASYNMGLTETGRVQERCSTDNVHVY